jgi:asparagine synthase (glutamine-hydrolysing)
MCGIAGYISTRETEEVRRDAVQRMCDRMLHRGPDDSGLKSFSEATLGMRRLAIFDPAHGHQPMVTPDGRFSLVFNGAIYNFAQLREELIPLGWTFRTHCDTEVLLAALAQWGTRCLTRLRGMFAFALWDNREHTLTLARGPFGIKPLYYHWRDDGGILFASELSPLLASRHTPVEIEPRAISAYLSYLSVPAPQTIYSRIRCLRPGQLAVWSEGRLTIRSYWSLRQPTTYSTNSADTYQEFVGTLRSQLDDTVRAHALADVPVGAFLSGGIDSSALVALLARHTPGRLKTFTLTFGEHEYSEQAAARRFANHVGTEHHEQVLTGEDVADQLPSILDRMDQPTGDGINVYFASALAARSGVKAVISGIGGDELFGGYPSFHQLPRFARLLPLWRAMPRPAKQALITMLRSRGTVRSLKLADFLAYARDLNEIASLQRSVFSETARLPLLAPDTRRLVTRLGPMHPMLDDFAFELHATESLRTVSAWEMRTYMADVLLSDSDVFSMAHSLELRTPFVDAQLVRWLWKQPEKFVFTPGRYKGALADAVSDLLPHTEQKRAKLGFSLPFPIWIRGPLRSFLEHTFSKESLSNCPWLDPLAVQTLWRDYLKSNDTRNWSRVWSLAMLIAFLQRHRA